jgi:predicted permease
MNFLRRFWFLLQRRRLDQGLQEEMRQHFELNVQEKMDRGMLEEEAIRAARLEFGNPALVHEHTRQGWGFPSLDTVFQDLRYALRQLRRNPGFTAVAVLTLALGIGANSAMFSFVNAFLLSSLPVKDPDELVHIRNRPHGGFEQKIFEALRDRNHSFSGLIAWDDGNIAMTVDGETTVVPLDFVSASSYSLLGIQAARGRVLAPEDDEPGSPAVAVISYAYWETRFGLDPAIIGKTVRFRDVSCTIIGVAPPWFHGLRIGAAALPVTLPAKWHQHLTLKDNTTFDLFGRLKRGVDQKHAQADLDLVYHQILQAEAGEASDPEKKKELLESRIVMQPAREGAQAFDRRFVLELRLLEAVVGLVLLIACVNLANLLLARGTARRREIGVRLALGAPRIRIVRQLLTENIFLALCGGVAGLLLSTYLVRLLFFVLRGKSDAAASGIAMDGAVFAFTALLSVVTGLVFGLAPALRASRSPLANSLRGNQLTAEGKPLRASRILVTPQIALSLVILILAGLLLRSLQRLQEVDLGFDHDHLLTFWLMPTLSGYEDDRELRLYDDVLSGINRLPGVRVASMSRFSLLRRGRAHGMTVDGVNHPQTSFVYDIVGPRFFETLRIPLLLGRDFTVQDIGTSLPVAIINESAAQKYFAGQNPIGRRISMASEEPGIERTIIGVARNMKFSSRDDSPIDAVYVPFAQAPANGRGQAMINVSTAVPPETLIPMLRGQVRTIAKDLPEVTVLKEDELINRENVQEQSLTRLLGGFGILALGLALLGLYGTVSYSVSQRIRELAIRMALGAHPTGLLWMVVRESLRYVLAGVAAGAALAWLASRSLDSFLFGVAGFDPITYGVLMAVLVVAAIGAAYVPARRATKVDPMIALRCE